ncbi:MAG TPA: SH3 domain-containing protein [Croceibacterium sp.]|nr:SH3 domain-containing protein [Croceibacterium sp.]
MVRPLLLVVMLFAIAAPAAAQDRDVPYWATLRADEINMRVGPSEDFPIEWVYRRKGLPVKVVRLREGWRLVQDPDGERGWILGRLLDPGRGAIVVGDGLAELRESPDDGGRVLWRAEPGVVGALGDCDAGWCRLDVAGRKGWVRAERLWGAGEP